MKICVVSLFTEEIEKESYDSTLNKQKYCEIYNIDYRFYLGRASERHAQWDKIQCILQNLPEYDYVIWMDNDAVFNNFNISFLDIINENKSYNGLFCQDVCYADGVNHLLINSGVMIFKNDDWSFDFLKNVWESIDDYVVSNLDKHSYDGFPHEQGKLCDLLLKDSTHNYKIFNQTVFNTHPNSSNENTFIIHFMGSRQSENALNRFIESVKKINKKNIINNEKLNIIKLKKHKICIVSHFTENIKNVGLLSIENKTRYIKKHNYDLKIYSGRLSKRHPSWDKIIYLKNILNEDVYDYVVWIDNDAFITNDSIRLDFICSNYSSNNLIICSEVHYSHIKKLNQDINFNELHNCRIINAGVFLLKNNDWSKKLLDEVWNTKSVTNKGIEYSHQELNDNEFSYDYWPYEQGPFHIALSKKNIEDYVILQNEVMNKHYGYNNRKKYFICHFCGKGDDHKLISSFMSSLENIDNEFIVEKKIDVLFRNSNAFLKYNIYKKQNELIIKFNWDYSNTGEKYLSHSFKIDGENYSNKFDFNSDNFGTFKVPNVKNLKIFHSYDWFGEYNWDLIYLLE